MTHKNPSLVKIALTMTQSSEFVQAIAILDPFRVSLTDFRVILLIISDRYLYRFFSKEQNLT